MGSCHNPPLTGPRARVEGDRGWSPGEWEVVGVWEVGEYSLGSAQGIWWETGKFEKKFTILCKH